MPRRNRRPRRGHGRAPRQTRKAEAAAARTPTTDQLARRLVARGLRTRAILDDPRTPGLGRAVNPSSKGD